MGLLVIVNVLSIPHSDTLETRGNISYSGIIHANKEKYNHKQGFLSIKPKHPLVNVSIHKVVIILSCSWLVLAGQYMLSKYISWLLLLNIVGLAWAMPTYKNITQAKP